MRYLRISTILVVVALTLSLFANPVRAADKPKVLATFSILGDVAQNVAGDAFEVGVIVPTDADAHDYSPKPEDVKRVADAQLILTNGARFEGFLDKLIKESGTKAKVVEVSKGVQILKFTEPGDSDEKPVFLGLSGDYKCAEPKEGEEAGDCDPHFWQNPLNVIKYTENIRDTFIALDAANKDKYTKNADAYIATLKKLDAEITAELKDIKPENRVMVTNHDALGYFAVRYNFKVAGVVLPGGAAGAIQEPDPKAVAELIESLKKQKVKAIFVENIGSDKLAKQIAEQAGVKVVAGLYTDALGEKGSAGDSYVKMMQVNLKAVKDALK
jgi:zinc/manganese transport system substrate-binding protein